MDCEIFRNEMAKVGKVISIDLEITDTKEALMLADTMYNGKSECGVRVHYWGLFSSKYATEKRDAEIIAEIHRHRDRMDYLMNPNNLQDFK